MSEIPNQSEMLSEQFVEELLKRFKSLRASQHTAVMGNLKKDIPSVIVIGAGVAGVKAAYELALMGMHVILLEAQDRIGGRAHTKLINHNPVEFGAQFLHGIKNSELFLDLVKHKIDIRPMSRKQINIYDESGKEIEMAQLMPFIEKIKSKVAGLELNRLSDDLDRFVAKELKIYKREIEIALNLKESDAQLLMEKLSVHELKQESLFEYKTGIGKKESENNYLICSGISFYLEHILSYASREGSIEVHLNAEVNNIKYEEDLVTAELSSGKSFKADAMICTLPLGVLQQEDVTFEPPLPKAKSKAIQNLKIANHEKVIMQFEKVFWPNKSHFIIPHEPHTHTWLDIVNLNYFSNSTNPVLVTSFHTGLGKKPDAEIIAELQSYLKNIFGKDYIKPAKCWVTHWESDPYIRGGYSYHPDGVTLDENSQIARPVDRLCFAGEHTFRGPASIKGAFESGIEAAEQVVQQLSKILAAAK
tara:strand:- start:9643 stop:11070 length:1428 start_codon:yes stop_codon:yes gene_type:complete